MTSKARAFVFEVLTAMRFWFATGGLWAVPRLLGKLIGGILLYAGVLVGAFILAGVLGILSGTYLRLMYDGSRLYFNVARNWAIHVDQTSNRNVNTFEAETVSDRVPFIVLDSLSRHWKDYRLSKKEVINQQYFQREMLPHGTKYIPWLWEPTDPGRPIKFMMTHDHVNYIAVVLIQPYGTRARMGLIALDDYEEYLRRTGMRKGGR